MGSEKMDVKVSVTELKKNCLLAFKIKCTCMQILN